jgi:hypothetical protein
MCKLIRVEKGKFMMDCGTITVLGAMDIVCLAMAQQGINWEEIEMGLVALEMSGDHVAHYGEFGTFLYTERLAA